MNSLLIYPAKNIILLILVIMFSTVGLFAQSGEFVPEELVCKLLPGNSIDVINTNYNTFTKKHLSQIDVYLLGTLPGLDAESLGLVIEAQEVQVEFCSPNYLLYAPEPSQRSEPFVDNTGGDIQIQAAYADLNLGSATTIASGQNVKVAVLDGGINFNHPALSANSFTGMDYVDGDSIAFDEAGGAGSGHGSFIAGIVNMVAPNADLVAYRILDTTGTGNGYSIADAILQAIEDSCKVINLSLGMRGEHAALDDAVKFAKAQNVMVIISAGNDSTDNPDIFPFPAYESYTYTVAAVDSTNRLADFSNFGGKVDICAPGTQILSAYLDTSIALWDGTSFAAPFVAGLVAAMYSINPDLTWTEVDSILALTAIDIDPLNPGFEGDLGKGLIDPVAALLAVGGLICGDCDASGAVDVSDAVYLIAYIFSGGPVPDPLESGDPDCSGTIDISDVVFIINYIFGGGLAPCEACL